MNRKQANSRSVFVAADSLEVEQIPLALLFYWNADAAPLFPERADLVLGLQFYLHSKAFCKFLNLGLAGFIIFSLGVD
jgi:hypothetical protein